MAPYMQTVYEKVSAITAPSGKDLFQLNEAIFNVERDDDPSPQLAGKLFAWIQKMHRDFVNGKIGGADENFFYDYLGLLGTMQNQHFFSAKQVQRIQGFMHEGLSAELGKGAGKDAGGKAAPAGDAAKLQKENDELKTLLAAVKTIQTFKLGAAPAAGEAGEGKKKGRKGKKGEAEPEAPAEEPAKEKKPRKKRGKKGEGEGEDAPKEEKKDAAPAKEGEEGEKGKGKRQRNRKGKKDGEGEAKEGGD